MPASLAKLQDVTLSRGEKGLSGEAHTRQAGISDNSTIKDSHDQRVPPAIMGKPIRSVWSECCLWKGNNRKEILSMISRGGGGERHKTALTKTRVPLFQSLRFKIKGYRSINDVVVVYFQNLTKVA
jgi:hypothetical protein